METGKKFSRLAAEIRDLLGKLSFSQKVTIVLLGLLLAVVVAVAVSVGGGDSYTALGAGSDAQTLTSMRALLDKSGIAYRLSARGDTLEVPRSSAAHVRWLAAESGLAGVRDTNLEWLFGEASLLDTESRMDQRLLESRKRTVEDAIRWSRSVRDARMVVQRGPEPVYAGRRSSSDSAAVAVALRPGVESLSRSEAWAIRTLVGGAFNIPLQNIQVSDDRLRSYPHLESPGLGSEEEEEKRRVIQGTVESLLGRIFRPSEFVVGVLMDISQRRSQLVQVTYDPARVASAELKTQKRTESGQRSGPVGAAPGVFIEGGLGAAQPAPPVEVQSRDEREAAFENRFSEVKESTEVPAGEVKGLSLNVVLDRAAVRRVLQAEEFTRLTPERRTAEKVQSEADIVNFTVDGKLGTGNLDQAIEAQRRTHAGFLREQIPLSPAKVNVSVVMFPRPEMPASTAAAGGLLGWAEGHWDDLLLGILALAALLALYRMFQRAVPPPLDVPPLEETVLEHEGGAGEQARRLGAEIAAGRAGSRQGAAEAARTRATLESVAAVNAQVKGSPQGAGEVLRMWLAEDEER